MPSKSSPLPSDLVQLHPGLGILRLAALFGEGQGDLDEESLDSMFVLMEAGVLDDTPSADMWPELARGLMGSAPSRMIVALRECGALPIVLPEVAGLFGVPDLADNAETVDLGYHLLNTLGEAAKCNAPLEVRFALLVRNVGKTDSPKEHRRSTTATSSAATRASTRSATASACPTRAASWPCWRSTNASACTACRRSEPARSR